MLRSLCRFLLNFFYYSGSFNPVHLQFISAFFVSVLITHAGLHPSFSMLRSIHQVFVPSLQKCVSFIIPCAHSPVFAIETASS